MVSVSKTLLLLATTFCLVGCSPTLTTPTDGTDPSPQEAPRSVREAEARMVRQVCRVWTPATYSSRDTIETQLGNRALNAARDSYCK